jgi:hypothetical protein
MADALTTITNLINSPPGQLAAGAALAGIVWKFFERVEAVLNEDTKLEIAVWLLDRKPLSPTFQNWPDTFAKVFGLVFGEKHLSWKCFGRSCLATLTACAVCLLGLVMYLRFVPFSIITLNGKLVLTLAGLSSIGLFLFDYVSLLETRFALNLLRRWSSWFVVLMILIADVVVTGITGAIPSTTFTLGPTLHPLRTYYKQMATMMRRQPVFGKSAVEQEQKLGIKDTEATEKTIAALFNDWHRKKLLQLEVMWLPTFFTSIWLWLYAGSGFLLKAARRFRHRLPVVQPSHGHREAALAEHRTCGRCAGRPDLLGGSHRETHSLIVLARATIELMSEQILALLFAERDKLNRAIEALGGTTGKRRGRPPGTRNTPPVAAGKAPAKPKRKLSAASRRAMVAAAKKRWALIKAGKARSPFAKRAKRKAA